MPESDTERKSCKECGDEAVVLLHGRFPFCKECYGSVIRA